jgi:uncharacterized protein (UPF0332 family)
MNFSDLEKSGQLKKEVTKPEKIAEFLEFAENEIEGAKYNYPKYKIIAYKSAYDALIHAGNALIRFYGYRPTSKFTHVTITEFADRVLSSQYGDLISRFKRMRRKRHPLQYEANFGESNFEINKSIKDAEMLVKKIEKHIGVKSTQKRLL